MAACVDVSRGTAYGLSLSQMAVSLGSVLFFPAVRVQVYLPVVESTNGTFFEADSVLHIQLCGLVLGPLLLLSAAWVVWFSLITMTLQDKNSLSTYDYNQESLDSLGLWNIA